MLDDVTSGFNISNNLSLREKYNEILGFTEAEVDFIRQELGISKSSINYDVEYLYNGYKFHVNAKNKLYNSSMINYFFFFFLNEKGKIKRLVDSNIKTDYIRINMLLKKPENVEKLEQIIETGEIFSEIIDRFSIDKIHEPKNFYSLLYYMGLVTIDLEEKGGLTLLKIPNYSVKTIFWEYMENIITEQNPQMIYNPDYVIMGLKSMAFYGDYQPFFDIFVNKFVSNFSNIDLEHFSEKNIKLLLLSIFMQTELYLPISETENSKGYTDIYLQRKDNLFPGIKTDWVLELKYVKQSDAEKQTVIDAKKAEALEQLKRYKTSNLFKDRTDVKYLMVNKKRKNRYISQEV
jgi:hypothetical protein